MLWLANIVVSAMFTIDAHSCSKAGGNCEIVVRGCQDNQKRKWDGVEKYKRRQLRLLDDDNNDDDIYNQFCTLLGYHHSNAFVWSFPCFNKRVPHGLRPEGAPAQHSDGGSLGTTLHMRSIVA